MRMMEVGTLSDRLVRMRDAVRRGDHRRWRQMSAPDVLTECEAEDLSWPRRAARLTCRMCEAELPIIGDDERIVFTRTVPVVARIYTVEDKARLMAGYAPHELGPISNICADWSTVLSQGLLGRRAVALESRARLAQDAEAVEFLRDNDLYPGVQQGDNGQSLTAGGVARDGTCGVNPLTWMVLRVGLRTSVIDPKINLRVDPDTDPDLLYLATLMMRKGLGFPQYSNDAVVIPALVSHGYAIEDARNYTVAACWEFTIQICNGGPITIELADSLFADEDSVRAVAAFVRTFATLGCQQMQLNRPSTRSSISQPARIHWTTASMSMVSAS